MLSAIPPFSLFPKEQSRFEQLYRLYRSDMYRTAFSILHTHQDAEDAVQEAFVRIAKNMSKVSDVCCNQTRAFAVIIVKNVSINMLHKASHEVPTELFEESAAEETTEELVLSEYGAKQIREALKRLPESYYEVLFLTACEGYSLKETARLLGITYENAKSRALRARRQLRRILEELGYERN